jgi:hypothetical protein
MDRVLEDLVPKEKGDKEEKEVAVVWVGANVVGVAAVSLVKDACEKKDVARKGLSVTKVSRDRLSEEDDQSMDGWATHRQRQHSSTCSKARQWR